MIGQVIAGQLPADLPADERAKILEAANSMSLFDAALILADAQEARRLLDAGDKIGAAVILEKHRQKAESAGLGALFDQMMQGVV